MRKRETMFLFFSLKGLQYLLRGGIILVMKNSNYQGSIESLLEKLCSIPAPSKKEENRALFCKDFLDKVGAKGVYIDSENDVIYPVKVDSETTLFIAHLDTVFSFTEPPVFVKDDEYLYCPGVGDDTSGVAILLTVAKEIAERKLEPKKGVIIALTTGEEGLGNLKGIKEIMRSYAGKIKRVYAFDGHYDEVVNKCVGSRRYEISVTTEGGHSFLDFGNRSAISVLASLIGKIESIPLPKKEGTKTTFNVGVIEGGTSVNTIAESAKMLYEYRSDDEECLAYMERKFREIMLKETAKQYCGLDVKVIGERPCSGAVDESVLAEMTKKAVEISKRHSSLNCIVKSGSTDCNIPMALGVPAVCVGSYYGEGQHTLGEKILRSSVNIGYEIARELILDEFEE